MTFAKEFWSTEDTAALKAWLSAPGAILFRKNLKARIAEYQIKSTELQLKAMEPGTQRFGADAEEELRHASLLLAILKEMDAMSSKEFNPEHVKVIV